MTSEPRGLSRVPKDLRLRLCVVALATAAGLVLPGTTIAEGLTGPARVVDGDTLVVDGGERLRLDAMDACELGQMATDADGRTYDCGTRAAAVLTELIGGQPVTCEPTGRDRWRRPLVRCWSRDGTELGRELVARGQAWAYWQDGEPQSLDYAILEGVARLRGLGVFAGDAQNPAAWRRAQR